MPISIESTDPTKAFANAQKAHFESLLALAHTAFDSTERLTAFNLSTARQFFADSAQATSALLTAKDLQEVIRLQTAATQPALEKTVTWSRGVYAIGRETRDELSKHVESQIVEARQTLGNAFDQAERHAPAGAEATVSAIKSALNIANTAFDTLSQAARQITDYADVNLASAPEKPAASTSQTESRTTSQRTSTRGRKQQKN